MRTLAAGNPYWYSLLAAGTAGTGVNYKKGSSPESTAGTGTGTHYSLRVIGKKKLWYFKALAMQFMEL